MVDTFEPLSVRRRKVKYHTPIVPDSQADRLFSPEDLVGISVYEGR